MSISYNPQCNPLKNLIATWTTRATSSPPQPLLPLDPTPTAPHAPARSTRKHAFREGYGRRLLRPLTGAAKQYKVLVEATGGKYPPSLADSLVDDVPGEPKAVLDLGCGSGDWCAGSVTRRRSLTHSRIIEAVRDFPPCFAVGVDLMPM